MAIDLEKEQLAAQLKGSLLEFTKTFYPLLTGRQYIISNPLGREPHAITVCRELTTLFHQQRPAFGKGINIPPGYGKSVMCCMFVAWCFAQYPDCNLYILFARLGIQAHSIYQADNDK